MACLNSDGKHPVTSDLLNSKVMNGANSSRISFTSQVGTSYMHSVACHDCNFVVL